MKIEETVEGGITLSFSRRDLDVLPRVDFHILKETIMHFADVLQEESLVVKPEPVVVDETGTWVKDAECLKNWPECHSFGYDPRCCRFPKSCSADTFIPFKEETADGNDPDSGE